MQMEIKRRKKKGEWFLNFNRPELSRIGVY
jgi:hypothetical protein